MRSVLLWGLLLASISVSVLAGDRLRMATTTSTENSGLLNVLNPHFSERYKVPVDVIAVGTGKALRLGENGDVDIVFVHAPKAEQAFVDAGFGIDRKAVMHNDFVIIGPADDPAGIKQSASAVAAFKQLYNRHGLFISRGDDSGTHKKEQLLWHLAGVTPEGPGYISAGQGMGAVLRMADDKQAYTLSDRGTFITYQDKIDLVVLYQGDEVLYNPYHIIAVNPARHKHVQNELARKYIDFITAPEGQELIRKYTIKGQALFYPDAGQ